MPGRPAKTRNTSCLASATQTSSPPKTTSRSRKRPVPCGSNTRLSSPGVWWYRRADSPRAGRTSENHVITTANDRDVALSSPGGHADAHAAPAAVEVGFEPTEGLPPHTLSRRAPSATRRLHRRRAYPNPCVRAAPGAGAALPARPYSLDRRVAKKSRSRAPHSWASTPPMTSGWWFRRVSRSRSHSDPAAPALGSAAP